LLRGGICHDAVLALIAAKITAKRKNSEAEISLNNSGVHFNIFVQIILNRVSLHQNVCSSKIAGAVAVHDADAHHVMGLPIGGVLAQRSVIPMAWVLTSGCRMCMSIFDIDVKDLTQREAFFVRELGEATLFGSGAHLSDHRIMK